MKKLLHKFTIPLFFYLCVMWCNNMMSLSANKRGGLCFSSATAFPKVLGGTDNTTSVHTLEIQPSQGNIAFGGYTSSSTLLAYTKSKDIIIGMISADNGDFMWFKRMFYKIPAICQALAFKSDGTLLVAALQGWSQFNALYIDIFKVDGTLVLQYQSKSGKGILGNIGDRSLIWDSNDNILQVMQNKNQQAVINQFYWSDTQQNLSISNSYQSTISQSILYTVALNQSNDNMFTIGSFSSSNTLTILEMNQSSSTSPFTKTISFQPQSGVSWIMAEVYIDGDIIYATMIDLGNNFYFSTISSENSVYYQGSQGFKTTSGLRAQTSGSSYMAYTYLFDGSDFFIAVFQNTNQNQISLKQLRPLSGMINPNILKAARFIDISTSYYVGNAFTFRYADTFEVQLSQQYGFVMPGQQLNKDQSCLYINYTLTSTPQMIQASSSWQSTPNSFVPTQIPFVFPGTPSSYDLSSYTMNAQWCQNLSLPTLTPATTTLPLATYTIYGDKLEIPFSISTPFWSYCFDTNLPYSYTMTYSKSTIPSDFQWQQSSPQSLSVYTKNESAPQGKFDFTLTCSLNENEKTYQVSQSRTVNVINPCLNQTLTANASNSSVYFLNDPKIFNISDNITSSNSECDVNFTITSNVSLGTGGYSRINTAGIASFFSNDVSLHGLWIELLVNASFFSNSSSYAVQIFNYQMSACKIDSSSNQVPTYPPQIYYDIGSGPYSFTYDAWNVSNSSVQNACGSFEVQAYTFINGSEVLINTTGGFINHWPSNRTVEVQTNSSFTPQNYTVQMLGTVGTKSFGTDLAYTEPSIWKRNFEIVIKEPCKLVPPSITEVQSYTVNDTALSFFIPNFEPLECFSNLPQYTARVIGESRSKADWITFDNNTLGFTVSSKNNNDSGTYTIVIEAEIYCDQTAKFYRNSVYQTVIIIPENKGAPQLASYPEAQSVTVGSSLTYKLPAASDPDGEGVLITVILDKAQNFTKYNAGIFVFSPALGDEGTYNISIILIDMNRKPLSTSYDFVITVNRVFVNNENYTTNQTNQTQQNQTKNTLYQSFSASITQIDQNGMVVITFSDSIKVQSSFNLSWVNDTVLQISLVVNGGIRLLQSYDGNYPSQNYAFTWKATELTSGQLSIQLYFQDPSYISFGVSCDSLMILSQLITYRQSFSKQAILCKR